MGDRKRKELKLIIAHSGAVLHDWRFRSKNLDHLASSESQDFKTRRDKTLRICYIISKSLTYYVLSNGPQIRGAVFVSKKTWHRLPSFISSSGQQ
jgi:hypothetical protein